MESNDLSDPLARLVTTAQAIDGLRDLFAAEEPLDEVAKRVAETALAAIPYADVISITVLSWPDSRTVACTDEEAVELDNQQYASGRGPCLEAAMQRSPLRAVIDEAQQRWPEFAEAAQRAGIRASLSVPLMIDGADNEQELVGSLNIYSRTATAFDQFDAELMRLYSVAAGQAISNSNRW
ncbi:response regulator receiver protein, partial [Mycobacterium sp. ITM-2017-0098]